MSLPNCCVGVQLTGQPEAIRAVVDALLSNNIEVSWDDRFNRESNGDRTIYAFGHRLGAACTIHRHHMNSSSPETSAPGGEDAPSLVSRDDASSSEGAPNVPL